MALTITIAGIDRTSDLLFGSLSIEQVLTYSDDTCDLTIKSGTKPTSGQEIIITDGATKIFAGIIDDVQEDYVISGVVHYKCKARDYGYMVDRRLVVETYDNEPGEDIFNDIVTKYLTGFTTTHVQTGAPTVEAISFDYKRPSDCFKDLCDYIGWQWYVDYDKDLWFFNPSDLKEAAPVIIDSSAEFRELQHHIDTQGLRNRVYVRGGTILSDTYIYEVKADGVAQTWSLPHKPHELTMTVGAVAVTVGIENVDDESSYDYMMNYQEKYVRCSTGTAAPADGTTMHFEYKYDSDVISMVEDTDSQAAIAAVQGGDGIYEHVIVDTALSTIEAAEAAAEADLREHGNPKVQGSFKTMTGGWAPGQLLDISLPTEGIEGTYTVQKIRIRSLSHAVLEYQVEYGGRLIAIEDLLQSLVSAQQKKDLNSTEVLHKFAYQPDDCDVTDALTTTTRNPPFYFGDADAIFGFTQVAQGVACDGTGYSPS